MSVQKRSLLSGVVGRRRRSRSFWQCPPIVISYEQADRGHRCIFPGLSGRARDGTGFPVPGPITSAAINDQRRRLSVSAMGLPGTSPTGAAGPVLRRASLSTNNSDSIDENAIEEEENSRTTPNTPFTRRMSIGAQAAMRNMRPGLGNAGSNDQGFNWSEQLRSRAESNVAAGSRPSFSFASGMNASPPRGNPAGGGGGGGGGGGPRAAGHDRAQSVSDMPAPPAQARPPRQPQKPDHFQERILKGDFYMD
ncbi:hypothetical protein P8C59_007442 [Phyllachora maydis]|uniref:Uncharacterized protein n=1 Tax=Phyllachora maydis TaxID=1825666 RepID=A0AAD9MDJ7_9PEZI|nr:hypothetical protein P8C59_007442 [Phyllachora maydis]